MKINKPELFGRSATVSRIKLFFIVSFFFGPLIGAFVWYYGLGASLVPGRSNHAPLVVPVVVLSDFNNPLYVGAPLSYSQLPKKWSLIHVTEPNCHESCRKALYNTRQVRLAVGKDVNRIQRLIVTDNPALAKWLQKEHPDALILQPATNGIEDQIAPILQKNRLNAHDALLADPLGNIMMIVPFELEPGLFLKDLKKLLKLSHVG